MMPNLSKCWRTNEHPAHNYLENREVLRCPGVFPRGSALGPTEMHRLVAALDHIRAAFGMPYLVGSALNRRDPRDIDVRLMLDDDDPLLADPVRVSALNDAISIALRHVTDLPVDFQFQSTSDGNDNHPGPRSALFSTWWNDTATGGDAA